MTDVYKHMFLKNIKCIFGIWLKMGSCSCWGANCHLAEFPMPVTQFWREGVGDSAKFTKLLISLTQIVDCAQGPSPSQRHLVQMHNFICKTGCIWQTGQ